MHARPIDLSPLWGFRRLLTLLTFYYLNPTRRQILDCAALVAGCEKFWLSGPVVQDPVYTKIYGETTCMIQMIRPITHICLNKLVYDVKSTISTHHYYCKRRDNP